MSYYSNALRTLSANLLDDWDEDKVKMLHPSVRKVWASTLVTAALRMEELEIEVGYRTETIARLQTELDKMKNGIGQLLR